VGEQPPGQGSGQGLIRAGLPPLAFILMLVAVGSILWVIVSGLPNMRADVLWLLVLFSTDWPVILGGLGVLTLGAGAYLIRSMQTREWPFRGEASRQIDNMGG